MTASANDNGRWTRTPTGEDPRAGDARRQDAEHVARLEQERVVEHDELVGEDVGEGTGSVGRGEARTGGMGVSSERGGRQAGYPHDA